MGFRFRFQWGHVLMEIRLLKEGDWRLISEGYYGQCETNAPPVL